MPCFLSPSSVAMRMVLTGRAHLRHFRMLDHPFLHNADLLVPQLLQERFFPAPPFFLRVPFNAHAAAAFQRLADQVVVPIKERFPVLQAQPVGKLDPVPVHLVLEQPIERGLVVEQIPVGLVVHPADDGVAQSPGDLGLFLLVGQPVHFGDLVIHVARVVFQRAAQHVAQKPQAALSAPLLQDFCGLPHGFPVHAHQPFEKEGQSAHFPNSLSGLIR